MMDFFDFFIFGYVVVLGVMLLFLYLKFKKFSLGSGGKVVFVVVGVWLMISYFLLLGGFKVFYEMLGDLGEKYGLVYMIWIGVYLVLVVNLSDVVKEIFIINDLYVFFCFEFVVVKYLGYNYVMFGFFFYG